MLIKYSYPPIFYNKLTVFIRNKTKITNENNRRYLLDQRMKIGNLRAVKMVTEASTMVYGFDNRHRTIVRT